jgi:pyruvate,water dikinase
MDCYVLELDRIDRTQVALAGGKGAHLGALSRLEGVDVPAGFCVTTNAFRRVMADLPSIDDRPERLAAIREALEHTAIPDDVAAQINGAYARLGERAACAVRSSATAEDLPGASFAGQHDSYLNVVGPAAILAHVGRCWASLFGERAVSYRQRNRFDHRMVQMAVVVQQMVVPTASGVLFTADPVTGNRKVASVEACPGLGEALVSGQVNADSYRVRDGEVVERSAAGGEPVLTDDQLVRLVRLGRRIEAHLGGPQDIEWCLADGGFQIVQSRPITTLFPIPEAGDAENHVYLSVGHQQMMTDPLRPLGLSFWQMTTPRPMAEAGGRLFVDVTALVAWPASRPGFLDLIGRSDPLMADALETVLARAGFVPPPAGDPPAAPVARDAPERIETDPAIPAALIADSQASVARLQREIRAMSGPALLDFILEDLQELRRILFDPTSHLAIMAGIEATWWLGEQLQAWLGERNAADTLAQSVPGNVTSEMGLALLDVADVVRSHPEVVAVLRRVEDEGRDGPGFLDELAAVPGGPEARDAIQAYLDRYGMRCTGEIDITRPRWSEQPATLVPVILGNVRNFEPGAARRRFDEGLQEAQRKEQELLERLRALPDGERKAEETKRMIDRLRTFGGYREYPKFGMVSRYFLYKQAVLEEAGRLVGDGVLEEPEDVFDLRFDELQEVVRTRRADLELIRRRQDEFRSFQALTPPRVLTSDGEGLSGTYRRGDAPAVGLPGLPVSAGTVEGRARVVRDLADAELGADDILVTTYTDPSWTPLFVAIKGLVTEVGGLMTHGAVIAREYGLPAVVGVHDATRLIADGQRIRVHGTDGYVELLSA